ncbi:MAG: hypothetical protein ABI551_09765, partial [Polyangiaceae bacterium]
RLPSCDGFLAVDLDDDLEVPKKIVRARRPLQIVERDVHVKGNLDSALAHRAILARSRTIRQTRDEWPYPRLNCPARCSEEKSSYRRYGQ